jgi:hypothetical protein
VTVTFCLFSCRSNDTAFRSESSESSDFWLRQSRLSEQVNTVQDRLLSLPADFQELEKNLSFISDASHFPRGAGPKG